MNFNPQRSQHVSTSLAWLGLAKARPVAGLHITAEAMTLVAVQHAPRRGTQPRLVAVGRESVPDGAVDGTELRSGVSLVPTLVELMRQTRLPTGTPVVVTLEPVAATATISDEWESDEPVHEVPQTSFERATDMVERCGLNLLRLDIVPAALARFGRQIGPSEVALRSPDGWSVLTSQFFTDAERVGTRATTTLAAGRDLHETAPLSGLVGIDVPQQLRSVVDPGLDAVAVGAALAGFGQAPLVSVRPAPPSPPLPPSQPLSPAQPLTPQHREITETVGLLT